MLGVETVAALTDSAVPEIDGALQEKGALNVNIGGIGKPDAECLKRVDVYLRFGDAPAPVGRPELGVEDEFLAWEALPDRPKHGDGRRARRAHGAAVAGRRGSAADPGGGRARGRTPAGDS